MTDIKLCKDCRHYRETDEWCWYNGPSGEYRGDAKACRRFNMLCGPEGKWWEAKDE